MKEDNLCHLVTLFTIVVSSIKGLSWSNFRMPFCIANSKLPCEKAEASTNSKLTSQ